jgi:hypothetical protein
LMEAARAAIAYAGAVLLSVLSDSAAVCSVTSGLNNSKTAKW